MASDENNVIRMLDSVTSAMQPSDHDTYYDLYLLVHPGFTEESKKCVQDLCASIGNCDLHLIEMENAEEEEVSTLIRGILERDQMLQMELQTLKQQYALSEKKLWQLQFLMQQREAESYDLQRSLTETIKKTKMDLRTARETIKKTKMDLRTTRERVLPPIWYTMAGSRVGRFFCSLFRLYRRARRVFHQHPPKDHRKDLV